ncbi:hypothetical protein ACTXT7_013735 [Hymenolepis weldensis]
MGKKKIRNRAFEKANEKGDHVEDKKLPKGLINVGNTCYFNSTLQCLSRVSALPKWINYLSHGGSLGYLKRSSNDGNTQTLCLSLPKDELQFSRTFVNFVEDLLGSCNTRSSITPECLRKQLMGYYKQLNNNAQHDSHEALRCILDRLRFEERRLWQRAILDEKKYTSSASEELKEEIKSWGQCTGLSTTVDRTFGGVLLTSIQCAVCKSASIRFETFLDLSLPISLDDSEPNPYFQKIDFEKKKKGKKSKKFDFSGCYDLNKPVKSSLLDTYKKEEPVQEGQSNKSRVEIEDDELIPEVISFNDNVDNAGDNTSLNVSIGSIGDFVEFEPDLMGGYFEALAYQDKTLNNNKNLPLKLCHGSISDFKDIIPDFSDEPIASANMKHQDGPFNDYDTNYSQLNLCHLNLIDFRNFEDVNYELKASSTDIKDEKGCHGSFVVTSGDNEELSGTDDDESVQHFLQSAAVGEDDQESISSWLWWFFFINFRTNLENSLTFGGKKDKKGNRHRRKYNFELESDFENGHFDGDEGQSHSGFTNNNNNVMNKRKNEKRSTKKNKYGRNRWLENIDNDKGEENKQQCKSNQEQKEKRFEHQEENGSVCGVEEQQEGGQNGGSEFDLYAEEEEDENTFLPKMTPFIDDSDNNVDDNASLEPNLGSISDFRDIMVDDLDGDSNRSTGSPESVIEFFEEEGEGQDGEGLQKGNEEELGSPLSSIESEKKSLASTSTGDAADMEDNADDVDGLSTISLPKTAFNNEVFCEEFIAKSRLANAGNVTSIAQPEEEKRAKELSICSILEQQGKDDLLTDLERCLTKFFEVEELKGDNRITCDECTKKAQASAGEVDDFRSTAGSDGSVRCDSLKRDLLLKLPAVLTIQLKRYQRPHQLSYFKSSNSETHIESNVNVEDYILNGYQLRKCNKPVSFPINLDIRPYCSRLAWLGAEEGQYRLFGIVEHSGSLSSGHYVAYVAENTDGDIPADRFIPTLDKPFPWPLNLHHLVYQLRRSDQSVLNGDPSASNRSDQEDNRTWHHFSDTSVHKVPLSEVLSAKPYLLFYQRMR